MTAASRHTFECVICHARWSQRDGTGPQTHRPECPNLRDGDNVAEITASAPESAAAESRLRRTGDGVLVSKAGSHIVLATDDRGRICLSAGATLTIEEARDLADRISHAADRAARGFATAGQRW